MSKIKHPETFECMATVYVGAYWRDKEYDEYEIFATLEEAVNFVIDNLPVEGEQWYRNDFLEDTINVNASSWSGGYVRRKEVPVEARPKVDVNAIGEEE